MPKHRGKEQQQLDLQIGVAHFGEKDAAENGPARQQSGDGGGYAHLQQQGEQQTLSAGERFMITFGAYIAALAYVSQSPRAM